MQRTGNSKPQIRITRLDPANATLTVDAGDVIRNSQRRSIARRAMSMQARRSEEMAMNPVVMRRVERVRAVDAQTSGRAEAPGDGLDGPQAEDAERLPRRDCREARRDHQFAVQAHRPS